MAKTKDTQPAMEDATALAADTLPEFQTPTEQTEPKNELRELTELLQRTQANFENYRKQTEKRVEEFKLMAAKDVLKQLLPVVDNFQLALHNATSGAVSNEFTKGIELIYAQLVGLLEEQGVQPIITENQLFNAHLHEPLLKVESHLPENTILEEFQRGFLLHGMVLRPARVKISSGKKSNGMDNTKILKESETKNNN